MVNLYSNVVMPLSKALRYDPCVTRGSHSLPATHTQTIPAFTPKPQGIATFWLVLIAPTQ